RPELPCARQGADRRRERRGARALADRGRQARQAARARVGLARPRRLRRAGVRGFVLWAVTPVARTLMLRSTVMVALLRRASRSRRLKLALSLAGVVLGLTTARPAAGFCRTTTQ